MNRERFNNDPTKLNLRQRIAAGVVGLLALGGAYAIANAANAQEGIPCDPVIDNECVPEVPDGPLPTLPDKGPDTTVPETTTTTVPEIVTTTTTTPEIVTTTTTVPEIVVTVPPARPDQPATVTE